MLFLGFKLHPVPPLLQPGSRWSAKCSGIIIGSLTIQTALKFSAIAVIS